MRFLVLVKANRDYEAGRLPDRALLAEMGAYNEALIEAGVMLAGEGLYPSAGGVRVRFDQGRCSVVQGPFAQTGELVAGFWIWSLHSMDQAIGWLRRCPMPAHLQTEMEIRPIYEAEEFGAALASVSAAAGRTQSRALATS